MDCFVTEHVRCLLTCICANAITNFECGASGCNLSGTERRLSATPASGLEDYNGLEIAWFDPWTYLALVLFLILLCVGAWRVVRSPLIIQRGQSQYEIDKHIV